MVAGIIFAGIQPIHPPDVLSSVTTGTWAIITTLKVAMGLLFLVGITGIYARQVEKAGWLGLAGFLLFSLNWALLAPFGFAEAFILPLLATEAPTFVQSFLGMFNGHPGGMDLGALATIYAVSGVMYMLGGLLFGIATLRAGILPRWAAGLLAVAAALTPAAARCSRTISSGTRPSRWGWLWPGWAMRSGPSGASKPRNPYLTREAPSCVKPQQSSKEKMVGARVGEALRRCT